jgi:hypothetical protein
MFLLWWRMPEEGRRHVWQLYGKFSGLMFCGSIFGAVSWGVNMQALVLNFSTDRNKTTLSEAESLMYQAKIRQLLAAFSVLYALEFICVSMAKLMVLDRMREFVARSTVVLGFKTRHFNVAKKALVSFVIGGNLAGLGGNIAVALYYDKTAQMYNAASAAYSAGDTVYGSNLTATGREQNQVASFTRSVQAYCEVAVLLMIVLSFVIVGILCMQRIRSALLETERNTRAAGRYLRLRIVGTSTFTFVAFLLRSVFSIMYSIANGLQNGAVANKCPNGNNPCLNPCFNVHKVIQLWLIYSPEFQLMVVMISSPLALLVALWGMTSERILREMRTNTSENSSQIHSL